VASEPSASRVVSLQTADASGVKRVRLRPPSAWSRQLSCVNSLLVDRDLILPRSGKVDVFPGMRLGSFARAGARSVRRFARTGDQSGRLRSFARAGAQRRAALRAHRRGRGRGRLGCFARAGAQRRAALRAHRRGRLGCFARGETHFLGFTIPSGISVSGGSSGRNGITRVALGTSGFDGSSRISTTSLGRMRSTRQLIS
jgi:hypothetical protein